jgi:hypothetical protein
MSYEFAEWGSYGGKERLSMHQIDSAQTKAWNMIDQGVIIQTFSQEKTGGKPHIH